MDLFVYDLSILSIDTQSRYFTIVSSAREKPLGVSMSDVCDLYFALQDTREAIVLVVRSSEDSSLVLERCQEASISDFAGNAVLSFRPTLGLLSLQRSYPLPYCLVAEEV